MKEYVNFSDWRQDTEFSDPSSGLNGIKLNKRGRPVMPNMKARAIRRRKREENAWPYYFKELNAFMSDGGKLDHYNVREMAYMIMNMKGREEAESFLSSQGWKRDENKKWFDPNKPEG